MAKAPRTKQLIKPECKRGCRFIQITDQLWLCPHAAYGFATNLKGAIEEGRRMMERAGGYAHLLAIVEAEEARHQAELKDNREHRRAQAQATMRYAK